ncbi:SDR family NAD(P)-dependent oxidoreductase [Georgenia sp. Z1491]|uniref:SDR family NAD(P)-dependent oxidoreductase n=1 Tax=Georgenia sp. Z1491 TaxID=3416707 RepID=UPI003CEC533F
MRPGWAVGRAERSLLVESEIRAAGLDLTANDADISSLDPDVLLETFRANLVGMFLVTKHGLPTMLDQGAGSIVNMASVSGMAGESSLSAYGMSKASVIHFTKQVAVQYGKQGIRCNAIAPAFVNTRNNKQYASQEFADVYLRHMVSTSGAEPQNIADVVVFLSSDEAALVNGHVIPVDGGITEVSPIVADVRELGGHTA